MADSQQPVSSRPLIRQWEDTRSDALNAVEAVGESGCRASPLANMGQRLSLELPLLYLLLYLLALILGLAVAARQRAGHEVPAS